MKRKEREKLKAKQAREGILATLSDKEKLLPWWMVQSYLKDFTPPLKGDSPFAHMPPSWRAFQIQKLNSWNYTYGALDQVIYEAGAEMIRKAGYPSADGNDREIIEKVVNSKAYSELISLRGPFPNELWDSRKLPSEVNNRQFAATNPNIRDLLLSHVTIPGDARKSLEEIADAITDLLRSFNGNYDQPLARETLNLYHRWYGDNPVGGLGELPKSPDPENHLTIQMIRYYNGRGGDGSHIEANLLTYLDAVEQWLKDINAATHGENLVLESSGTVAAMNISVSKRLAGQLQKVQTALNTQQFKTLRAKLQKFASAE